MDHDVMMTSYLTRPLTRLGQWPDPVNDPTQILTRPDQRSTLDPVNSPAACATCCHALPHAPNLLMAREGACEGISGQFWYLQTRIEILYNVVYSLCMFEAFTDMKMRIEPYLHLGIRVFSRIFVFPYGFGNTYGS